MWDRDQGGKVRGVAEVRGCTLLLYVCVACALDTNGACLLLRVTEVAQ